MVIDGCPYKENQKERAWETGLSTTASQISTLALSETGDNSISMNGSSVDAVRSVSGNVDENNNLVITVNGVSGSGIPLPSKVPESLEITVPITSTPEGNTTNIRASKNITLSDFPMISPDGAVKYTINGQTFTVATAPGYYGVNYYTVSNSHAWLNSQPEILAKIKEIYDKSGFTSLHSFGIHLYDSSSPFNHGININDFTFDGTTVTANRGSVYKMSGTPSMAVIMFNNN